MNPRERVRLGRTSLEITRFGLGTAPLASLYQAVPESEELKDKDLVREDAPTPEAG